MTPASPAPLMPNGFSGDGVSWWPRISWPSSACGISVTYGIRKSMNDALSSCPSASYAIVSYSAPAMPCATPPCTCPCDDHRVDHVPAVVHHRVAPDGDLAGVRVDLDDRGMHPGGEGRSRRRVVVPALQAGLVVLGDRRLVRVGRSGELGRRLGGLVERVAQRVGQHRDLAERDGVGRVALHRRPRRRRCPGRTGRHSEDVGGHPQGLGLGRPGRQRHRRAGHHRGPRRESADGITEAAGVAGGHPDPFDRHAELVRGDLGEHRLVPLTLGGQPDRHLDGAVGLHLDVRALVGPGAGALDVAAETDAEQTALVPGLRPFGVEGVPADQLLEHHQLVRVVAGVVDQRAAVLEDQPLVVGELVGLDEVGRPHRGAVEPEAGGDRGPSSVPSRTRPAAGRRRGTGVTITVLV